MTTSDKDKFDFAYYQLNKAYKQAIDNDGSIATVVVGGRKEITPVKKDDVKWKCYEPDGTMTFVFVVNIPKSIGE
jgi:hypothetical protein